MRFKKGGKVEVLVDKEELSGSWRCGEIISGNGHNYSVKYDCSEGVLGEVVTERVSRKAIRPCPPVMSVEGWAPSDVVEVFDDFCWKIATVLKVMNRDYYLVKLLGSLRAFSVHKYNIRVRQSWQDDQWVVISKASGSCMDVTLNCYKKSFQVSQANMERKVQAEDSCLAVQNNIGLQEYPIVTSRTLKRPFPNRYSLVEVCTGGIQKMRAIEKDRHQQVARGPLLEKVDALACPRENLVEKYKHASFNNRTNGKCEMVKGRLNGVEQNDFDSDACSVGSCSIIKHRTSMLPCHNLLGRSQDSDTHFSSTESFYDWEDEEEKCPLPLEEDFTARIHMLELHAYCSTLEAFYASGPLSWEQEVLLTNLRFSLRISNDEHLMELKKLVSRTCLS